MKNIFGRFEKFLDSLFQDESALGPSVKRTEGMRLSEFIEQWKSWYSREIRRLAPFKNLSLWEQKPLEWGRSFVRYFYDARGHFDRFLFLVGSRADNEAQKEVVLDNLRDEFGGSGKSHEELYFLFAEQLGCDVSQAVAEKDTMDKFNEGHLKWLSTHDADHRWAAFSAYEALDNIDYENLYELAKRLGASGDGLLFFEVHKKVAHYGATEKLLEEIWERNPEAVVAGFDFIGRHQLWLWRYWLPDSVFSMTGGFPARW